MPPRLMRRPNRPSWIMPSWSSPSSPFSTCPSALSWCVIFFTLTYFPVSHPPIILCHGTIIFFLPTETDHGVFSGPLRQCQALYSLDFFDLKGDSGQTKWFIVTTVLVVLATYFVSGVMIVIVQDPSRVARVFDRLVVNTGVGARAGRSQPGGVLGN